MNGHWMLNFIDYC
ncbi:hypothetical protein Pint_31242 [Pistacia integerrima]|uniref:Uncharacterized protein n=1 Tax=Pistacia integerrima TaxID=434235 RepID=A0ACC0XSM5_9ROSI|nr:hypothetical protein Pint_31242 [Pistacia integerrima]